ncbi:16S rRNA (guanine(966)-N(2))-methyltransferase RsmD [Comamonas sp. NLF-1-9]|uniref:16S rRNA (guanine(966)-N(2))-methyltransferase RsmD n=1 Tax=Comamonas sp. NLF-1-9 TaxID=2853163 RepID=UPI001C470058|nr:16S rRNA (guanine(966)-N(2))-methyltransferase RsmD [Comamonas sp. NLF-1-9]QXL83145.1 16S rRNA (guanine(966)-N(2))-methyltransferase RsmD [Comamonas sp. NLF-1-9]
MKARTGARAPGEVRIIGGQYKRTRVPVLDRPGLRPTPDRVRETLFNWLGQDLTGWRCIDVFAGSGALGLEAASRGAAQVLLVEQDALLVRQITQLAQRLQAPSVQVRRGDGLSELARCAPASLDLVLLDPPFDAQELLPAALKSAAQVLAPGGSIYLEAARCWDAAALQPAGLVCQRYLKAGAAHAHLLRRAAESY